VFSRGGPDRTLDLTYNKLYGEFPRFLVRQGGDLGDACLCTTNFSVSAGNQLYCPTRSSLSGFKATPTNLDVIKNANYTCLLPNQRQPVSWRRELAGCSRRCAAVSWRVACGTWPARHTTHRRHRHAPPPPPTHTHTRTHHQVMLSEYLATPANYISDIPARSELPAPEGRPARPADSPSSAAEQRRGRSSGLGPGEIAGIVIGSVAGAAILGALAYFVGYKKLWKAHSATSFKRSDIPDGPSESRPWVDCGRLLSSAGVRARGGAPGCCACPACPSSCQHPLPRQHKLTHAPASHPPAARPPLHATRSDGRHRQLSVSSVRRSHQRRSRACVRASAAHLGSWLCAPQPASCRQLRL
jgi:hypothetical protein